MLALNVAVEKEAKPRVVRAASEAAGHALKEGEAMLLSLTAHRLWLPLPLDIDPLLVAWLDPNKLRPLWATAASHMSLEAGAGLIDAGDNHWDDASTSADEDSDVHAVGEGARKSRRVETEAETRPHTQGLLPVTLTELPSPTDRKVCTHAPHQSLMPDLGPPTVPSPVFMHRTLPYPT